jgi:DNA-directed RNA polymerase specialized sigma24 family protein
LPALRGEQHGRAKLTQACADAIRAAVAGGAAHEQTAERFGVSRSTVQRVIYRKAWNGDPVLTDAERFDQFVLRVPFHPCWEWIGADDGHGYGVFRFGGMATKAYRVAWELAHGRGIPRGLVVCHQCDNPGCVRPDHLFLGTHGDNVRDMAAKNRVSHGERHCHAKLTEAKVREIRLRADRGEGFASIAESVGCSPTNVYHVAARRTWRRVADTQEAP